jgi:hypothetical protein
LISRDWAIRQAGCALVARGRTIGSCHLPSIEGVRF